MVNRYWHVSRVQWTPLTLFGAVKLIGMLERT